MKNSIFILIAVIWFVFSGLFIAERFGIGNWIGSLILYSMGFYWIYPYIFSKTMYFPYSAEAFTDKEENNTKRMILFALGLLFSSMVSML
ncbi:MULTISPECIES: hypothetical protein [Pseudoalteromonas]|uniref:hypothetical protein n=1 Tax=Pseudoalteromonas TaxID=53246 RepID=UPI0024950B9D|nr:MULTISPECIES: hypothetical protein [Pseudoalteromonas]MDN3381200.1 hypothetical protein [Pseudoalteromonas sp. APC 3358]